MKSCNWTTKIGRRAQQICCLWVLCSLTAAALLPLPGVSAAPPLEMHRQIAAPLTVERSSATEVVLMWQAPALTLAPVTVAGVRYTAPRMVGLSTLAAPGEPQLPSATLLLAVPPGAMPVVTPLSSMTTTVPLSAPLLPAPVAAQPVDPLEPLPQPAQLALPAAPTHYKGGLFPAAVATVSLPQQWRSQQVVRVRINPMQVDDARRQLVVYQTLRVAVRFVGGDQGIGAPTGALGVDKVSFEEGPFEPLLAAAIANYPEARAWPRAAPANRRSAPPPSPWLRITTERAGLHRIDCAALTAAGVDLGGLDPATFRLYRDGPGQSEVAILPDGMDEHCNAVGGILFNAEAVDTVYTGHAVYWLTYGGTPGLRMDTLLSTDTGVPVASYPHTSRHEVNRLYYSYIPLAEGAHHWFWDILAAPTGTSRTYTFTLAALAPGSAQLALDVAGYDGGHRTQVALNGQSVADLTWSGRVTRHFDLPLNPALLVAGFNQLTVTAVGGKGDYQYMDGFTVTTAQPLVAAGDRLEFANPHTGPARYHIPGFSSADLLIFDVSDPVHPQWISGAAVAAPPCPCTLDFGTVAPASYLVTSRAALHTPISVVRAQPFTLHDPDNQADYLVIAPAAFHAALAPLLAQRTAQGLRTQLVDLQAVYDEFGGGEVDPFALRAFLAYTLAVWRTPAPTYVLLVGDGTNDPRGYVNAPFADSLPAFLRTVDPRLGETASDNQYVTLGDGDNLPQFALGRFPARTAADVAALVEKTLRYETQSAPGDWRRRIAIIADNAFAPDGAPDAAGNFWQLADGLADDPALVAAGYTIDRLYYNPCSAGSNPACVLADPPYPPLVTASAVTTALRAAVAAGRQLLVYVGHGSPIAWAGNPSLLTASEVEALTNADRLTVALELTCYTGFFQAPRDVALAETLLAARGGAAATWASSGVSVARGHDALARGFLAAVAQPEPATVGLAAVAGKVALWAEGAGAYRENLDTFHLFGDPALRLAADSESAAPLENAVFLPWIRR